MARLFVAVWPSDEVLERIAILPRPDVEGLRWTNRSQWHVTLRFLGHVDDVAEVADGLRRARARATTAVLGPAVDRFGQRVLHVPVAGLDDVAAAVIASTAAIGRPPDDRPFHGHLTLARVRGRGRVDLRPLTGAVVTASWPVDEVCLVESKPHREGSRYEVVDRVPLDGGRTMT